MSLSDRDLAALEDWLQTGECTAVEFRRRFPGLSFTWLDPLDVRDTTPVRVCVPYRLYLVDGREHCWRMTANPAAATGIALVKDGCP